MNFFIITYLPMIRNNKFYSEANGLEIVGPTQIRMWRKDLQSASPMTKAAADMVASQMASKPIGSLAPLHVIDETTMALLSIFES